MSNSTNVYTINVKQDGTDGKVYWKPCGVAFLNVDDSDGHHARPKSISLKLDLFPNVEIVAFPRRERPDIP
ncbi:MAG: hypothetical protein OXF88_01465 [Rhodobacteraceae bacterium]|nr:hypothetical protein [Paracoccaceae bacterium]MCY4140240.1 hypothetical protein [Paracoccaceae bacterium]